MTHPYLGVYVICVIVVLIFSLFTDGDFDTFFLIILFSVAVPFTGLLLYSLAQFIIFGS